MPWKWLRLWRLLRWRSSLGRKDRSATLRKWFELVTANRQDLATILTSEQGKPFAEALGEIDYAASYIEFYAEEAKRVVGELLPSHRADARIMVLRQPISVIAAIAPALAAGLPSLSSRRLKRR